MTSSRAAVSFFAALTVFVGCPQSSGELTDAARNIEIVPTPISGEVHLGRSISIPIEVRNAGAGTVHFDSVYIEGEPIGAEFRIAVSELDLAGGASETIRLAVTAGTLSAGLARADLRLRSGTLEVAAPIEVDIIELPLCDDGNPCTQDTVVDGPEGVQCQYTTFSDGSVCDDDNVCTANTTCQAGSCVGQPIACDDEVDCTLDSCDPQLGCIVDKVDSACSDDDPCTADICHLDGCTNETSDNGTICYSEGCTATGVCDNGDCNVAATPDGFPCNDGNHCTTDDACEAGICASSSGQHGLGAAELYEPLIPSVAFMSTGTVVDGSDPGPHRIEEVLAASADDEGVVYVIWRTGYRSHEGFPCLPFEGDPELEPVDVQDVEPSSEPEPDVDEGGGGAPLPPPQTCQSAVMLSTLGIGPTGPVDPDPLNPDVVVDAGAHSETHFLAHSSGPSAADIDIASGALNIVTSHEPTYQPFVFRRRTFSLSADGGLSGGILTSEHNSWTFGADNPPETIAIDAVNEGFTIVAMPTYRPNLQDLDGDGVCEDVFCHGVPIWYARSDISTSVTSFSHPIYLAHLAETIPGVNACTGAARVDAGNLQVIHAEIASRILLTMPFYPCGASTRQAYLVEANLNKVYAAPVDPMATNSFPSAEAHAVESVDWDNTGFTAVTVERQETTTTDPPEVPYGGINIIGEVGVFSSQIDSSGMSLVQAAHHAAGSVNQTWEAHPAPGALHRGAFYRIDQEIVLSWMEEDPDWGTPPLMSTAPALPSGKTWSTTRSFVGEDNVYVGIVRELIPGSGPAPLSFGVHRLDCAVPGGVPNNPGHPNCDTDNDCLPGETCEEICDFYDHRDGTGFSECWMECTSTDLEAGCINNNDCDFGEICVECDSDGDGSQSCLTECSEPHQPEAACWSSEDCPAGYSCLVIEGLLIDCPDEGPCPPPWQCTVAYVDDPCASESDCPVGSICSDPENDGLNATCGPVGGQGAPCTDDENCIEPYECHAAPPGYPNQAPGICGTPAYSQDDD